MLWVVGESDLKKAMGNQRIRTTRWKTNSWNKFSSPYEAQPDSLLEKDHLTSKWLWFPNTPWIFLNSPRILGMLSLAALQTLGSIRRWEPPHPAIRDKGEHSPLLIYQTKMGIFIIEIKVIDKVPKFLWDIITPVSWGMEWNVRINKGVKW